MLNLNRKAMVKRRISQLEPHRADGQSSGPRGRTGSDLRRRGSAHSVGSDSLLELYTVQSATSETEPYARSAWPAPSLALIPEVASVSQISEPRALSVSPLLDHPAQSVDADGRLAPLVELLQDQATKHYYHTNDLKDQIASLNSEMHTMFQELEVVIGGQPTPDVDVSRFEETLGKSFAALETTIGNLQREDDGMVDVRRKLDVIHDDIRSLDVGRGTSAPLDPEPNQVGEAVLEKLENLRTEIKGQEGLPEEFVMEIAKLREVLDRLPSGGIAELRNVAKSQELASEGAELASAVELSEVHAKLDELIESLKSQSTREPVVQNIEIPDVCFLFFASLRRAQVDCIDAVTATGYYEDTR